MSRPYDDNPFVDASERGDPRANLISSGSRSNAVPNWIQDNHSAAQNASESGEDVINPEIPRMIVYTRVANLALSICMILASSLSLLTTTSATTGVLACYVVVFSCLLCCFETHLKQVSKFIALNFGFMYSAKSRAVFMLFVGTILFSFSLFGEVIGLCMLVNAAFNIYILFKYPGFDEYQRKDAQSEILDFLSNNPAFSKQIVTSSATMVAQNPELAAGMAKAFVDVGRQDNHGGSRA